MATTALCEYLGIHDKRVMASPGDHPPDGVIQGPGPSSGYAWNTGYLVMHMMIYIYIYIHLKGPHCALCSIA